MATSTERPYDNVTIRSPQPIPSPPSRPTPVVERVQERSTVLAPTGPRVRWGGVMSGFVVALGALMLLTALGLAIGLTALDDLRVVTRQDASGLGLGAGVWAFLTLLVTFFLAGMVSTRVTDRPDRGGAILHGALVWVLCSVFLFWMIFSGISLGLSGLFGAVGGLARGAATAAVSGGDLTQSLGLDNPSRFVERLDDPQTVTLFATATGVPRAEAEATLNTVRTRINAVRDDPERVAAEVRSFAAQYADRAKQQALNTAATVQAGATKGSWVTFGVLVATLIVAILGALSGVPDLRDRLLRARMA
jgi:hypothetical protein